MTLTSSPTCTMQSPRWSDYRNLNKLLVQSFPHMKETIPMWMTHIKNHEHVFVCKNGRKMMGMIDVEKRDDCPYLNFIAIDPTIQHQGLGSSLLQTAEGVVKQMGGSCMRLHTEANSIKNMHFYTKNGFIMEAYDPNGYQHTASMLFFKKL